jgi:hypothetical protein
LAAVIVEANEAVLLKLGTNVIEVAALELIELLLQLDVPNKEAVILDALIELAVTLPSKCPSPVVDIIPLA